MEANVELTTPTSTAKRPLSEQQQLTVNDVKIAVICVCVDILFSSLIIVLTCIKIVYCPRPVFVQYIYTDSYADKPQISGLTEPMFTNFLHDVTRS